jgi:hypothetical protein
LFAQNTSDFEIQGNDDGTMTILNYKGLEKDIVIPEKIFNMKRKSARYVFGRE